MPEILQSPSQQNLAASYPVPIAAEPIDSELLQCSICKLKYDCDSRPQVPHVLPTCGHTICAGCIEKLVEMALRNNVDGFNCPHCNSTQPVDSPCPTNWILKSHIDSLRNGVKVKRKRTAPLPQAPAQDLYSTCPRHVNDHAEILCIDCAELSCFRCGFECMQKQHRCVKQDAMLHSAAGHSIAAIEAAFERGKLRVQERLDEEIRRSQAAAARLNRRLEELCALTKSAEDDHIKSKIGAALSQKDVRALCQLLQADAAAPAFDVDIQVDNLIVRRRRKVTYDNGTVYEGFVNVATGLADGEGSVTWGPTAGRSSRKTYTGQFTAGRTAERVKFKWTEKRPGQISVGSHAYNGTVELMHPEQVETGAWTGQAFIQYDVSEGGSYEGGVADGKYHGRGKLTDTLGNVTAGHWNHGQLE